MITEIKEDEGLVVNDQPLNLNIETASELNAALDGKTEDEKCALFAAIKRNNKDIEYANKV